MAWPTPTCKCCGGNFRLMFGVDSCWPTSPFTPASCSSPVLGSVESFFLLDFDIWKPMYCRIILHQYCTILYTANSTHHSSQKISIVKYKGYMTNKYNFRSLLTARYSTVKYSTVQSTVQYSASVQMYMKMGVKIIKIKWLIILECQLNLLTITRLRKKSAIIQDFGYFFKNMTKFQTGGQRSVYMGKNQNFSCDLIMPKLGHSNLGVTDLSTFDFFGTPYSTWALWKKDSTV